MHWSIAILFLLLSVTAASAEAPRPAIELDISGEVPDMQASLLAHLSLADLDCEVAEWRLKAAFREAPGELRAGLQAFGYYNPVIEPRLVPEAPCWSARFRITPGDPVVIRAVDVRLAGEGRHDEGLQAYITQKAPKAGSPLRHQSYEAFKRGLGRLAASLGYLKWRWLDRRLLVDPEHGHADIVLVAQTGPLHRVGDLRVSAPWLDPRLLDGLNPLRSGQPLSSRALISADRQLSDSGYFADVDVQPALSETVGSDVPVDISLRPRKRHSYRIGVGIDSDTGPRLSGAYEDRLFNARGHRILADLSLATELSSLNGRYEIPILSDPTRRLISLTGALIREDTDVVESDRIELAASYRYPRGDWREEPFIKLVAERSRAGQAERIETEFLTLAGIRWDISRHDDPINTRRGHRLGFSIQGGHEALLSDASILQGTADASLIRSAKSRLRLIARAGLGLTLGDTGLSLPPSQRFYAGGDRSVRGYDYQRLSPRDATGEPRGGSHLATASVEVDYPVYGDWYGALFADAGTAADSVSDLLDPETAVGVGVRWLTPVGRLKVDLAFPQNTTEDEFRIHFGLGADL